MGKFLFQLKQSIRIFQTSGRERVGRQMRRGLHGVVGMHESRMKSSSTSPLSAGDPRLPIVWSRPREHGNSLSRVLRRNLRNHEGGDGRSGKGKFAFPLPLQFSCSPSQVLVPGTWKADLPYAVCSSCISLFQTFLLTDAAVMPTNFSPGAT